jgi:hypothetical protein
MGFLRWLLGLEITHDEAVRIATQFAWASWDEHTADWPDRIIFPYDLLGASLGGNYWYVKFQRRLPDGVVWASNRLMVVWVHKKTGEADYGERICQRYFESLDRGE